MFPGGVKVDGVESASEFLEEGTVNLHPSGAFVGLRSTGFAPDQRPLREIAVVDVNTGSVESF